MQLLLGRDDGGGLAPYPGRSTDQAVPWLGPWPGGEPGARPRGDVRDEGRREALGWPQTRPGGKARSVSPGFECVADLGQEGDLVPEVLWQVGHATVGVRAVLALVPLLGENSSGPLGAGLLSSGVLGETIREIQATLR